MIFKYLIAIIIGVILFFVLCVFSPMLGTVKGDEDELVGRLVKVEVSEGDFLDVFPHGTKYVYEIQMEERYGPKGIYEKNIGIMHLSKLLPNSTWIEL